MTKSGDLVRGVQRTPPQPFQDLVDLNTDRVKTNLDTKMLVFFDFEKVEKISENFWKFRSIFRRT